MNESFESLSQRLMDFVLEGAKPRRSVCCFTCGREFVFVDGGRGSPEERKQTIEDMGWHVGPVDIPTMLMPLTCPDCLRGGGPK